MTEPEFLALDEVLAIHRDQLDLFGGRDGALSPGLLESAMAKRFRSTATSTAPISTMSRPRTRSPLARTNRLLTETREPG